jgi:hypothetical protein
MSSQDDDGEAGEPTEDYDEEDSPGASGASGGSGRPRWMAVAAVVVLLGLGLGLGFGLTGGSSGPPGPEGVPLQHVPDLASADSTVHGTPVDGITCRKGMQADVIGYHIHVHLDIFVNGRQARIPAGAGIVRPRSVTNQPGGPFYDNTLTSCLYWLHVHADDGIIHVESPSKQTFDLGQFFDIWGQPLGPDQVGPASGPVVAFVNGTRFAGNPRDIQLLSQDVIQLDVGAPVVAFKPMTFTVTGLCSVTCTSPPNA